MSSSRPVPWVSPLLYGAVLIAGGYGGLAGVASLRPAPFLGGLAALFGLDLLERRRWPERTPAAPAVALLVLRAGLFALVTAADGAGLARVLFLLLPFTAYFAFGAVTAVAIGAGCAGLLAASLAWRDPGWYAQAEPVTDLLMFVVGLVLTIAVAAVAVAERAGRARLEESHAELRAYADQVSELSAAAERNRVARDIHDGLGHHLTAIAVLLEKATAFRTRDPAVTAQAVEDAHRSARRALADVRRSVRTLRAGAPPFRLAPALAELVREGDDGRMAVTLACTGDEAGHDPATLSAVFRAAQEGLTNARRHSGAGRVSLTVHYGDSGVRLEVADDGCGFTPGGFTPRGFTPRGFTPRGEGPGREGFGLLGMRERVQAAGGTVALDTAPGRGTRLRVTIPGGPGDPGEPGS